MINHDIVCIATDRLCNHRMRLFGGYNIFPNIDKIAKNGTIFSNAVACSASTLSCHATEWTGKYTWEIHDELGVTHAQKNYDLPIVSKASMFTDLIEMGYDVNLVFMQKPNKYFPSAYQQLIPIFNNLKVNIHGIPEWDTPQGFMINREKHIMYCANIIEKNRSEGKKTFIWTKIAGMYQSQDEDRNMVHLGHKYHRYAGQLRVTRDDVWQCAVDEAIGSLMKHFNYGKENSTCPEIIFSSDHGAWYGERGKAYYGYDLHEEIINVPLISSFCYDKEGKRGKEGTSPATYSKPISMKNFRHIVRGSFKEIKAEDYQYSETLYPGQIATKPGERYSKSKTSVRCGKYKYIYNPWGCDGMSEKPTEELYDIEYDPHEKFNLANFDDEWFDCSRQQPSVACEGRSGLRYCDVMSRFHSDISIVTQKEDPPEADYCVGKNKNESGSGERTGWDEIRKIREMLSVKVKELWYTTGRKDFYREVK